MHRGISETLQNWFFTFSILYLTTFSFIIALICVYALPDKSVHSLTGSYYVSTGFLVFSVFLLTHLYKNRLFSQTTIEKKGFKGSILSWVLSFVVFSLSSYSVVYPLIFIYTLQDKIPDPVTGFRFLLSGSVATIILILIDFKVTVGERNKAISYLKERKLPFEIKKILSDKILNFIIIIYSIGLIFLGFGYSLICIYSLPDRSIDSRASGISFTVSLIVLVCLITSIFIKRKNIEGDKKSPVPPKLPNL